MYKLVVIESPYAPTTKAVEPCRGGRCLSGQCADCMGAFEISLKRQTELLRNVRYARECVRDSLMRGEAPYASHLLYTQIGILDDDIPTEREHGIQAGFAWRQPAVLTAVYSDLGISRGMEYGIEDANKRGCPLEFRSLPGWNS